jgi:hypothetical protein
MPVKGRRRPPWSQEVEDEGFVATDLDAVLGEDTPDAPKAVLMPRFQESLSRIPADHQRKIKGAIQRIQRRKVR